MDFKKAFLALFLVMAIFSTLGCAGTENGDAGPQASSLSAAKAKPLDEATALNICKTAHYGTDDKEREKAYPLKDLPAAAALQTSMIDGVALIKTSMLQTPKVDNIKVYNMEQDGNHAQVNVTITYNGQSEMQNLSFIRVNGEWCMNCSNIKDGGRLKLSGHDDSQLKMEARIAHTFNDEPIIIIDVQSLTSRIYAAGWTNPVQAVLITDQGEFTVKNFGDVTGPIGGIKISSQKPERLIFPFGDAKGTPLGIRLIGFNELNSRGLPANLDSSQILTLSIDSVEIIKSADDMK